MIKKNIFKVIVLLYCAQNGFALNSELQSNTYMPKYTASFKIPSPDPGSSFLVLRFYQAFGDGSNTGWQLMVSLPEVTLNGKILTLHDSFSYSYNYLMGQIGLGYDQYAQYYGLILPNDRNRNSILSVTGTFQQVAYMSAAIYHANYHGSKMQDELLDRQMSVANNALNPYIVNNPSVFAYTPEAENYFKTNTANIFTDKSKINTLNHLFVNSRTGKIDAYRLDKQDSDLVVADDIAPDGCSRAYLFAQKNKTQQMIILRIKVPKTFIENNNPDKLFANYQTRYFSVGAHRDYHNDKELLLDYWTVNARMLKDYMDDEGYAYVFFAPNAYTHQIAIQQNTPATQPPVMNWGRYKGYLLGNPNYAIIIRYRDPDPNWQGSPENARCYATPDDLQPVTKDELGDFLPEIYGDTLENFNAGHIGIVNKDAPWPG